MAAAAAGRTPGHGPYCPPGPLPAPGSGLQGGLTEAPRTAPGGPQRGGRARWWACLRRGAVAVAGRGRPEPPLRPLQPAAGRLSPAGDPRCPRGSSDGRTPRRRRLSRPGLPPPCTTARLPVPVRPREPLPSCRGCTRERRPVRVPVPGRRLLLGLLHGGCRGRPSSQLAELLHLGTARLATTAQIAVARLPSALPVPHAGRTHLADGLC
eukprot:scaffold8150_cov72-Phaeocystis_antarctica.AAC.14